IMLGILLIIRKRPPAEAARFVLPLAFATLAGALLARTALNIRSYHYGFALAMPATMVFVAALVGWIPQLIARGDSALIVRGAMIAALFGPGYAYLRMNAAYIARRTNLVSANGDSFYAAEYGQYAQKTIDYILTNTKPSDTLTCMPEGLLINFITRRVTPVPDMNFNPPSLVMYGEENMLARLRAHPPDRIALVGCDTSIYGARFFGQHYGRQISLWIHENYEPVRLFGAPPFRG